MKYDTISIARKAYQAYVDIIEVEVYFGWSIPHEAPLGGFAT